MKNKNKEAYKLFKLIFKTDIKSSLGSVLNILINGYNSCNHSRKFLIINLYFTRTNNNAFLEKHFILSWPREYSPKSKSRLNLFT